MSKSDYTAVSRLLLRVYLFEAGLAVLAFGLYKATAFTPELLASKSGVLVLAGLVVAVLGAGPLFGALVRSRRSLLLAIVANVLSILLAALAVESALRLAVRSSSDGIMVAGVPIRPTWSDLVAQVHAMPPATQSFFVYDSELGWTVGPGRSSPDGVYMSSAEGVRSDVQGVRYRDETPAHRVALIGDSNAFSLEVPFGESWGFNLGRLLGSDVQVLNFGVDGYGIDQVYLRYERDVRPWKPSVVVIGFIQHDLLRSMAVYPFVSFGWPGYLVKPRFDVVDDRLAIVNRPLPSPAQIALMASPQALPFIDYDAGYVDQDWSFRFDGGPLLLRLLTSISPRWVSGEPRGNADTATLNSRLLNELIKAIERDGAVPVLIYLPHWNGDERLARTTLRRSGLPYLDMTACLKRVPEQERRVASGQHYTGRANAALARCTLPAVRCGIGSGCD
jgi:hypothetical protein